MAALRNPLVGLGIIFAALSILSLVQSAFDYAFGRNLAMALREYESWTGAFIDAVRLPALVEWLRTELGRLGLRFDLHADWQHVLLIISLYFTRDIANNLRYRTPNGFILILPAAIFAVAGAIGFGWLMTAFPYLAVAPPVLALAIFEYVEAVVTSHSKHRPADQTAAKTMSYYMEKTIGPRFLWAVLVIIAGAAAALVLTPQNAESVLLLLPLVYLLIVAWELLARGVEVMHKTPANGANWYKHLWNTSNSGRLGLLIVEAFGLAALAFALDFVAKGF